MKKVLFLIFVLMVSFLFVGCSAQNASNPVLQFALKNNSEDSKLLFEDEKIKIKFSFEKEFLTKNINTLNFELKNKTELTMKLLWEQVTYIDTNGRAQSVLKSGVRFIERDRAIPPTTIPSNSMINDLIIPKENVNWNHISGSWIQEPLLKNKKIYDGKTIRLLIPLEIEEEIIEYNFIFKISYE
jgi:uncharacterized protein YcfL